MSDFNKWERGDRPKKDWTGGGNKGGFKKREEGPAVFYRPAAILCNRDAPPHVVEQMIEVAKKIEATGRQVRLTGLDGPEENIEKSLRAPELYLPWDGFNDKKSKFSYVSDNMLEIIGRFHGNWAGLKPGLQKIISSSARCVLGKNVQSVAVFMVCWSADGAESYREKTQQTGNLSVPLRIATEVGIPVFNLGKQGSLDRLNVYLNQHVSEVGLQAAQPPAPSKDDYDY